MLDLYMKNTPIIYLSLFILVLLSVLPLVVFREGITGEGQISGEPGATGATGDFTDYVNQSNILYNKNNEKNRPTRRRNKGPTQCMNETTCNAFVRSNKGPIMFGKSADGSEEENLEYTSADAGTSYNYVKNIKMPSQMGVTDDATMEQIGKDVEALIQYVALLIEGKSTASLTPGGGPMGNKFFVQTPGKCNDIKTNTEQDRYLFINNIPTGNNPMAENGANFSNFRGLIPGMMSNMDVFDPQNIANALLVVGNPDCMKITMDTVDINNVAATESNYVTLADIAEIDPCLFPKDEKGNQINPQTGEKCLMMEGFTSNENKFANANESYTLSDLITDDIKNDYIAQLFLGSFSLFAVYLLYKGLKKVNF
jgi:hypothetical protein